MVTSSDDGTWLSPKWVVATVALVADVLLMSYDLRLGIAASVLIGVVLAIWFYLAVRYGALGGAPSGRNVLAAQVRRQADNRRDAAARSGAQQSADPPEGA